MCDQVTKLDGSNSNCDGDDIEDDCEDNELRNIKNSKQSGFKNIVKRIQLAARLSNVNQDEETDRFHEDVKYNLHRKNICSSNSIQKRGSRRKLSRISQTRVFTPNDGKYIKDTQKNISGGNIYINGEIKFLKEEYKHELKPFITIEQNISQNDIGQVLRDVWQLDAPKIVTFVISNKSRQSQWDNKKQIKNFQIGIAKAAMSTNMWILTNGINSGITSYICSAIENELKNTRLKNCCKLENFPLVFGVTLDTDLTYGNKLSNLDCKSIVCLENSGLSEGNKFELNAQHSHYVIIKKSEHNNINSNTESNNFLFHLITMLVKGENFSDDYTKSIGADVPLVSILIEGGPENVLLILNLIKKQFPVVVLQGSGGLANIFAYVYYRIWTAFRDLSSWDPDYIEDYIKPLLIQKLTVQFPDLKGNHTYRNILRDQIIECVRLSRQDGRQYLVILDMYNTNSCNLAKLSEYLLNALLKSRRNQNSSTNEQILKDFDLIVDWNCAHVAKNLLFTRNLLNLTDLFKSKFLNILIRNNREEFVEIFLCYGFQLHKFLTPSQLSRLFRLIHEDDFFHTVCWETALGQSSFAKQNKFFIENDLNWLIEVCTGLEDFVNTEDLHLNSLGLYAQDILSAERKALTLLSIWAVLQNRHKLAQVFWKYCDHPVHHALLISMMFDRLSWHVLDTNLKAELKQNGKVFADYANGVLDQCYNENINQAYNVLKESIKDWNYMTAVDIAANAQRKQFLAHPCCQKWLTNTFYGKIRLRDITWGFFTMPTWLKILLCSFLIFPMYIWIRFKSDNDSNYNANEGKTENEDDVDVYETMYNVQSITSANNPTTITYNNEISVTSFGGGYNNKAFDEAQITKSKSSINYHRREVFVKKQPPLWRMIIMMWSSPITKFYTSQLFYIIFLLLISLAALSPNCASFEIEVIVFVWTISIAISYIRQNYILFLKYSSVSIYPKIAEIVLILTFATVFLVTRIIETSLYSVYGQKMVISLALFYFYYRLISIYFPNSPTLGPLLHRIYLMITVDFFNFMRITTVIIVCNVIVINALQYPYRELTPETVYGVFHQGILSLFYSPPKTVTIETDVDNKFQYCRHNPNHLSINQTVVESQSFLVYLFVYQYYTVLRLIVVPLLFSIFAASASNWVSEIDSIWKFQRYHLVIDFANRLAIPEPLSLFYYIYFIFYHLFYAFAKLFCLELCNKKNMPEASLCPKNIISSEDCLYWKQLAAHYLDSVRKKSEESQIIYKSWEYIQEISKEIEYEKKSLREIKGKVAELEKNLQESKVGMSGHVNVPLWSPSANPISVVDIVNDEGMHLSRMSPYPGTQINRYPLPRKYVSWNIDFFAYEPVCYSKAKCEFDSCLSVDENILQLTEESLRGRHLSWQMPCYRWNGIDVDPNGILVDRRSWRINDNELNEAKSTSFVQYKLENNFLPLNPCGRTGIRGKGALQRWAVNHYCIIIIAQTCIDSVDNSTILTKLLFRQIEQNRLELIEKFVNNEEELYELFTTLFDFGNGNVRNMADLQDNFAKLFGEIPFQLRLVRSDYLDDECNTDNAWKEANVYLLQIDDTDTSSFCPHKVVRAELSTRFVWCQLAQQSIIDNLPLAHTNLINLVVNYLDH